MDHAKALKAEEELKAEGYEARIFTPYFGPDLFGGHTVGVVVHGRWSENTVKDVPTLKDTRTANIGSSVIYY